jgi:hypothetical protein
MNKGELKVALNIITTTNRTYFDNVKLADARKHFEEVYFQWSDEYPQLRDKDSELMNEILSDCLIMLSEMKQALPYDHLIIMTQMLLIRLNTSGPAYC